MTPETCVGFLVEQQTEEVTTGPFIRRIAPDGTYSEYGGIVSSFEEGRIVTQATDPAWRVKLKLTADEVGLLEQALRGGFFGLAPEHRPEGVFADGFTVTWRACLDGREHTVVLRSVDVRTIPPLARLRDTFERVFGQAAARAGERARGG